MGKTTTATLVCEELGFSYIEMNASDTRNKKTLEEHISQSLSNKTMDGFLPGNSACSVIFFVSVGKPSLLKEFNLPTLPTYMYMYSMYLHHVHCSCIFRGFISKCF